MVQPLPSGGGDERGDGPHRLVDRRKPPGRSGLAHRAGTHGPAELQRAPYLDRALPLLFAFGAVTSFAALAADERGIAPREIFLTTMAFTTFLSRPVLSPFLDRLGHARMFRWFVALIPVGLALLCFATTKMMMVIAAMIFGRARQLPPRLHCLHYESGGRTRPRWSLRRDPRRFRRGHRHGLHPLRRSGPPIRIWRGLWNRPNLLLSALSLPYFNWARAKFERDNLVRGAAPASAVAAAI